LFTDNRRNNKNERDVLKSVVQPPITQHEGNMKKATKWKLNYTAYAANKERLQL